MGITSKIFGEKKTGLTEGYIDLEEYTESKTDETAGSKMNIRIVDVEKPIFIESSFLLLSIIP